MGIGPVPAIEKLLKVTGVSIGQIDVAEVNEAFAAQFLAVQKVGLYTLLRIKSQLLRIKCQLRGQNVADNKSRAKLS